MVNFDNYDNPLKARRVWNSYEQDIPDHLFLQAVEIVNGCRTADALDIRLDIHFGKILHFAGNDASSLNDIDEDCNGGLSNARKALEER